MKKLYKNRNQKKYANLRLILNDKSNYLKNLEKKRNDGIQLIKEQKARLLLEDIFKINKFNRNYSCLPFNSGFENEIIPSNKNLSQIINYPFKPKIIEDYSIKKVSNVEIEKPPSMNNYSQIPKNIYRVRNMKLSNSRHKLLAKAGEEIFTNNLINQGYKKYKLRKNNSMIK